MFRKKQPAPANMAAQPFFGGVQRKETGAFFQARLAVNRPGDVFEKEADAVADRVVNRSNTAGPVVQQKEISKIQRLATSEADEKLGTNDARMRRDREDVQTKPDIQRMCPECEKEKKEAGGNIQREASSTAAPHTASPQLSARIAGGGGGHALPANTQREMSGRLGADFSQVRVHTGTEAAQMNQELSAQAFTHGRDIYFNSGKFNPETSNGKHLLAHELTHVVQQGAVQQKEIQRSCSDGVCNTCAGGKKNLWVTFYFRRPANKKTMEFIRKDINDSKKILANCCINLKADFNWTLLKGPAHIGPDEVDASGTKHYNKDIVEAGTKTDFSKSKGLPILVVDEVEGSGGGNTVTKGADPDYKGPDFVLFPVNQSNYNDTCPTLAHELWHVSGNFNHEEAKGGQIAACTGPGVNETFCTDVRALAKGKA
jgi:hypothetical protein